MKGITKILMIFFIASVLFSETVFAVSTDLYATSSAGTTKFGNTASVQGDPDGSKSCNVTAGADTDYVYGGGYSNTSGGTINEVWITVRYNVTATSISDKLILEYSLDGGSTFGATIDSFYPTASAGWTNRTLNVTADRTWTYANIGNLRVYLYYDKVGGADTWRADIDALWVNLTYTPGSPLYSSNGTNVTEPRPNDWVLHYVNWSANSGTLSGYIFSNNYSGDWSNKTWTAFSGTWSNETNRSTSAGVYGWRVYTNNSYNNWNDTGIQIIYFSTRTLLVNWTVGSQINATTCQPGSPCQYYQYNQFNANATVNCSTNPTGLSCGSITGGIMYNDTATSYKWINTTTDATPFYISSTTTQVNCTNLTNLGDTYVSSDSINTNFGNSDTIYAGYFTISGAYIIWIKFNTSFNVSTINNIINATLYFYYISCTAVCTGRTLNLYNTSDRYLNVNTPWWEGAGVSGQGLTWVNQTTVDTLQSSQTFPASYQWMNWTVGEAINTSFNSGKNISLLIRNETVSDGFGGFSSKEAASKPYLTVCYNETVKLPNPFPIGTLNHGNSYLLNYTVNVTDTPTKDYKLIFNFTSSLTNNNPPENDTQSAYIRIISAVDNVKPTYSNNITNSTQVGTPVQFNLTMNDNTALQTNGQYIFGIDNCTGSFVNDSAVSFTSTPQTVSVVKVINSTEGCTIRWYYNFSDNAGNWNESLVTNPFSFQTSAGVWISISISPSLSSGILFGTVSPNTNDNNATNNTNGPGGGTAYNITIDTSTTVNVDLYHDANGNMISGSSSIGIGNVTHQANTTSNTGNNLIPSSSVALSTTYSIIGSNVCQNLGININCWIAYWLDVPSAQLPGDYNTTYEYCTVQTGQGYGQCG